VTVAVATVALPFLITISAAITAVAAAVLKLAYDECLVTQFSL
jgi:hypothetical protein